MSDTTIPRHANNFNAIRLILATSVILTHTAYVLDGDTHRDPATLLGSSVHLGHLAVAGFFVLSGYLIAGSWIAQPDLSRFLRNRVLRILPGFVAASLVSLWVVGESPRQFDRMDLVRALTLGQPWAHPAPGDGPAVDANISLWTIRFEFGCYLTIAALGLAGLLRRRWFVAGLFLLVLLWQWKPTRILVMLAEATSPTAYDIPRLLACSLAGVGFRLFSDRITLSYRGAILAAAILVAALPWANAAQFAIPTAGAYLLLAVGLLPMRWLAPMRAWPDVSYGVYLYGYPLQWFAAQRLGLTGLLAVNAVTIPAALVAGWASWVLVERPALRFKASRGPKIAPSAPTAEVAPDLRVATQGHT